MWIRGYVGEVVIGRRGEIIARHPRSYESEDVSFDPLHYLPLIERKINAQDQAAPVQGWDLPDVFSTLHRLMEARMGKHGKREYEQVLHLVETFELAEVTAAVKQGAHPWRDRLRRRQAFGPLLHRVAPATAGPGCLSISARATVESTWVSVYMGLLGCQE